MEAQERFATCCIERCIRLCTYGGSTAVVTASGFFWYFKRFEIALRVSVESTGKAREDSNHFGCRAFLALLGKRHGAEGFPTGLILLVAKLLSKGLPLCERIDNVSRKCSLA